MDVDLEQFRMFMTSMKIRLGLENFAFLGDSGAMFSRDLDDGTPIQGFIEVVGSNEEGMILLISSQAIALPEDPAECLRSMDSALRQNIRSFGAQWAIRDISGPSLVAVTHVNMGHADVREFHRALSMVLGEFVYGRSNLHLPGMEW